MARADGVHVGQDDLPPDAVREVLGDRRRRPVSRTMRRRSTRPLHDRARLRRGRTGLRHGHQGDRLCRARSRPGAASRRPGKAGRGHRRDHAGPAPEVIGAGAERSRSLPTCCTAATRSRGSARSSAPSSAMTGPPEILGPASRNACNRAVFPHLRERMLHSAVANRSPLARSMAARRCRADG